MTSILSAESNTAARDRIFSRIRTGLPPETALPDVPLYETGGDKVANFIAKLESFDGKAVMVKSREAALRWLDNNIEREGKCVYSAVAGFEGNFEVTDATDPHSANAVDICVGEGILGVGETGSVWVTEESLGLTACALFSTDLYLLLDSSAICSGIHQAYEIIDLTSIRYGSFFTGPSATADIEAVHITGAQGEISLTVILY